MGLKRDHTQYRFWVASNTCAMSQHWTPDAKMKNKQSVTKANGFKKRRFPLIFIYLSCKQQACCKIIIFNVDATNSDFSAYPQVQTQEVDDSWFNTAT